MLVNVPRNNSIGVAKFDTWFRHEVCGKEKMRALYPEFGWEENKRVVSL
jgi:hypothetical protein